jgi:hypothetical protein
VVDPKLVSWSSEGPPFSKEIGILHFEFGSLQYQ